jgi:hypothetical protein
VRYDGAEDATEDLELADTPDADSHTMGRLEALLAWHAADPVDAREAARHARICEAWQHNRNPFVDHPEWVECIFAVGGECANAPPYPPAPPPAPPAPPPSPSPPSAACLLLSGVIDGPLSGGLPKAAELYAQCDVAASELPRYALGKSTNGGGSSGPTLSLPAGGEPLRAGASYYVSYEGAGFEAFFGFAPNATGTALYVNGDDAIELYHDGELVDVFGDPAADGTGTAWEYMDGWAYRVSGTGASATWLASRFTYSGAGALASGCETLAAPGCAAPFPRASYVPPAPGAPQPIVESACGDATASSGDAGGWECTCCARRDCVHAANFPSLCVLRRCCTSAYAGTADAERSACCADLAE